MAVIKVPGGLVRLCCCGEKYEASRDGGLTWKQFGTFVEATGWLSCVPV